MITTTDDLGHSIQLKRFPERIVSLVPSLTELLFDLGLGEQVVGVTKFCIHPKDTLNKKIKVGGTKKFNFQRIAELKPDLIIANKEENYKEGVEQLQKDYPVFVTDIFDLNDAIRTIQTFGEITDCKKNAEHIASSIAIGFHEVKNRFQGSVLYFIWQSPDMIAASDNFIDHVLEWIGLNNLAKGMSRYPQLQVSDMSKWSPDYVLLSSEPYPFREKHKSRFQEMFPGAQILLVDGEMFSWYGSRLQHAPDYFMQLPLRANL